MEYSLDFLKTEEYAAARESFVKKASGNRASCTSVGFFQKDHYKDDRNPQCHIGLKLGGEKGIKAIFSGFQRDHKALPKNDEKKKEIGGFFFHWIKTHPVWGKSILNTTFEDVWENGWVFSTNQEQTTLSSAVFATRWPTEFPASCLAFKLLTEAGCHPDIAFLTSTISTVEEKTGDIRYYYNSGHMPCPSGVGDEFVQSFLKGRTYKTGPTFFEAANYSGIDDVFRPMSTYVYADQVGRTKLFQAVNVALKGVKDVWKETSDIFYTEEIWKKERAVKDQDFRISKENLPKVVKALNEFREEMLNA